MNSTPMVTLLPLALTQIPQTIIPSHMVTSEPLSNRDPRENAIRITFEPGETSTTPQPTDPASIEPPEPPERVEFAPGTYSAVRSSLLPSGPGVKQYILAVQDGQTMSIDFTSNDVPLSLAITNPSGIQYCLEVIPEDGGYRVSQSFSLGETGDYLVTLVKAEHTPSTNYRLDITIQ